MSKLEISAVDLNFVNILQIENQIVFSHVIFHEFKLSTIVNQSTSTVCLTDVYCAHRLLLILIYYNSICYQMIKNLLSLSSMYQGQIKSNIKIHINK